ncbi:hypothetical protein DB88DRAFT_548893 [Papiliotrema laurentii]|uniref:Uncharacterized protein n=1 Tax=Papiliotrema laurentii TaxID=5418 RepID=A0AAD9CSK3_PAPLA|nr:hypothetical protein DB88DRAFT_548893 [Papiliotrema laurentii]
MAYLIGSLTFFRYIFVHPDAVISATDRDQLCPPIASEILPPPGTLLVRYLPHVSMEQEARGNGRGILCEVYLKAEKAERGTCVGSCRMIGLGQTHMYGAGPSSFPNMVSPGVRVPCPNEMLEHQLHRERQQEWTGRGVKRAQFAALTGTTDLLKRGSLYATPGKAAFRDTHAKGIMATMLGPESMLLIPRKIRSDDLQRGRHHSAIASSLSRELDLLSLVPGRPTSAPAFHQLNAVAFDRACPTLPIGRLGCSLEVSDLVGQGATEVDARKITTRSKTTRLMCDGSYVKDAGTVNPENGTNPDDDTRSLDGELPPISLPGADGTFAQCPWNATWRQRAQWLHLIAPLRQA